MKFKALYSPKQFFGFKGATYRATDGFFVTEEKEVITFLEGHFAWQAVAKKEGDKKHVEPKSEEVKAKVKAKDKKKEGVK